MKKLIATVATIAFSVAFIGCGGAGDNPGENIEVEAEDTAESETSAEESVDEAEEATE